MLVVLILAVAGIATAYFGGLGAGVGSAATGTTQSLTLSPAAASAELYPGGQGGVTLSVANPNPGPVQVGSLALDPSQGANGFAVDGGHSGCDLSALSFVTQTNAGAGWTIPGSGSLSITLAGALSMTTSAAAACQGASFTIYLTAGP